MGRLRLGMKNKKEVMVVKDSDSEKDDLDLSGDDDDGEYVGKEADLGSDFRTEKSHSILLHSLDSVVKTKKERKGRLKVELAVPASSGPDMLSLCQSTEEEWLTGGKVLAGAKDKKVKGKSKSALVSSKKSRKDKEKSVSLTTSLEKPVVKRIQRAILYDHVKKDVSQWNSVVYHNRLAEQLVFPLDSGKKLTKEDARNERVDDFVPQTPLEIEIANILHGPGYVEKKQAEIFGQQVESSDSQTYVRNIEEALEKHSELSRLRALQSYELAKAKRRNKIKSKKYHRLLRREKIRKQLKEFEELQEKDPEAAMLKLEELDKARVQERMSLKHRNTSKWAKMQAARAKYNRDSRVALSEQLKISRDLTVKLAESSDEFDEDDDLDMPNLVKSSMENPWFLNTSSTADKEKMELYYTGYKKLWEQINARKERDTKREEKEKERLRLEAAKTATTPNKPEAQPVKKLKAKKKQKVKPVKVQVVDDEPEAESDIQEVPVELESGDELTVDDLNNLLGFANEKILGQASRQLKAFSAPVPVEPESEPEPEPRRKRHARGGNIDGDIDEVRELRVDESPINFEGQEPETNSALDFVAVRGREGSSMARKISRLDSDVTDSAPSTKPAPVRLINVKDYLEIGKGSKFDMGGTELELGSEDEEGGQLQNIAEAFEDDDVIGEFQKRKEDEVEAGKPKDLNLTLPGWGEWGGKDLKPSHRKKSRFILKAAPGPARKDAHLSHVILNEEGSERLKAHQVRQLPFPFTRVKDYEKMVRAPVGRTWLPDQSMKSLTTPKVITRLGAVIQPISEDALVKSKLNMNKPEKVMLAGLKIHN